MMADTAALPDPLYYLRNFSEAIRWVVARNEGLLSGAERSFAEQFEALSTPAQALLVRLLLRRGVLFRRTKLWYPEIERLDAALEELIAIGWLDPAPALTLHELFQLTTRVELTKRFEAMSARTTKQDAYDLLAPLYPAAMCFEAWLDTSEPVYLVTIAPMVVRFRLLHFGNFYQDWHEYTLAHLQIFRYETVEFDRHSRPFASRGEIELFYALFRCYESLSDGATLDEVIAQLPAATAAEGWLRRQADCLRYQLGLAAERDDEFEMALQLYEHNADPEARVRRIRVWEHLGRVEEAAREATVLLASTPSERVVQQVSRIVARLERRKGGASLARRRAPPYACVQLSLSRAPDERVEARVRAHLSSTEAPVFYVENSLIGSLFGLLCWDAIFHPLPGSFFHRFHSAPADLHCPEFVLRRKLAFERCFAHLDAGTYVDRVMTTFRQKQGIVAPFVHWGVLDDDLLQLALACIGSSHLKLYFARFLEDLTENATGLPDLVQFFPAQRTYRLIEVKGPGDRLQDHQRRWFNFGARHDLPMEVCQVRWTEASTHA